MPTLYNVSSLHLSPPAAHGHGVRSVAPGEGHEFTDEEAASIGAEWSERDPRAGIEVERAWKAKRDSKEVVAEVATEVTEVSSPAESGKE